MSDDDANKKYVKTFGFVAQVCTISNLKKEKYEAEQNPHGKPMSVGHAMRLAGSALEYDRLADEIIQSKITLKEIKDLYNQESGFNVGCKKDGTSYFDEVLHSVEKILEQKGYTPDIKRLWER